MISLHCNDNNQKALKALKEYINESKEASRLIRRKDILHGLFSSLFLMNFNNSSVKDKICDLREIISVMLIMCTYIYDK